jgi:cobalt-zinc-cadmium efflux system membrane fusion protein
MKITRNQVPMTIRLLVFTSWLVTSCTGETPETGEPDPHADEDHEAGVVELSEAAVARAGIRAEAAELGTLEDAFETTGRVDFNRDRVAHLGARLPGRVREAPVTLGQTVTRGEVLAIVDSVELGRAKMSYLNARARAELARRIYEREKNLYAERVSSQQEMLSAEADYRQAAAELASATQALRLYDLSEEEIEELEYDDPKAALFTLRAPFGGRVTHKEIAVGEVVTPDETLFTVADLSRVWIWIDLYEQMLRHVGLEDGVEVRLDAYPNEIFRGRISYLGDEVDAETRTLPARIDVDNPEDRIRPGMFARVWLSGVPDGDAEAKPASFPLVPETAVQRDGGEIIVFVALGDNRFERRTIQRGASSGGWVEILDGLEVGERVVVEGAFLLKSEASKESLGGHAH